GGRRSKRVSSSRTRNSMTLVQRSIPRSLFALALAMASTVLGCSGQGLETYASPAAPPNDGDGVAACDGGPCDGAEWVAPRCTEGRTRPCDKVLAEHNGVVSCAGGVQTCMNGSWSACVPSTAAPADAGAPEDEDEQH